MLEFCRKLEKTLFLFPNFSRAVVSYAAPQPSETRNMWGATKKKRERERDAWVLFGRFSSPGAAKSALSLAVSLL